MCAECKLAALCVNVSSQSCRPWSFCRSEKPADVQARAISRAFLTPHNPRRRRPPFPRKRASATSLHDNFKYTLNFLIRKPYFQNIAATTYYNWRIVNTSAPLSHMYIFFKIPTRNNAPNFDSRLLDTLNINLTYVRLSVNGKNIQQPDYNLTLKTNLPSSGNMILDPYKDLLVAHNDLFNENIFGFQTGLALSLTDWISKYPVLYYNLNNQFGGVEKNTNQEIILESNFSTGTDCNAWAILYVRKQAILELSEHKGNVHINSSSI